MTGPWPLVNRIVLHSMVSAVHSAGLSQVSVLAPSRWRHLTLSIAKELLLQVRGAGRRRLVHLHFWSASAPLECRLQR